MPKKIKSSKRVYKRRAQVNTARSRPYGAIVPARSRPLITQNHMVRNINVTIDLFDLEAALSVGDVASAAAATGVTVSSFVIRRITLYGRLSYTETDQHLSLFNYIPTNESWTFTGVPGVVEAKLAFVPPITSSGPFSSSQSGLPLVSCTWVTTAIFELQVVAQKPALQDPHPPSPAPSLATRVENFNIVNVPTPPRVILRK
jgi:hypothetical protein